MSDFTHESLQSAGGDYCFLGFESREIDNDQGLSTHKLHPEAFKKIVLCKPLIEKAFDSCIKTTCETMGVLLPIFAKANRTSAPMT